MTRGLTLALAASGLGLVSCQAAPPGVRVVLVTIDTLRYDSFAGGPGGPSLMPRTLARASRGRTFERAFQLADFVQVKSASLENGLLHVDLIREIPEAKKPRSIAITTTKAAAAQVIDNAGQQAAA